MYDGCQLYQFDRVIATVPSPVFLKMAHEITGDYAAKLERVKYQSAVCLVMQTSRPLSDIYWLNIADPDIPFIGVIEHTNFIPPEVYGGKRIIYVTNYLSPESPLYRLSCEDLLSVYEPHLKKINPEFDKSWVERNLVLQRGRRSAGNRPELLGISAGVRDSCGGPLPGQTPRKSILKTAA